MVVAMLLVHLKAGFFAPNGIEFTLSLFGSTVLLAIAGGGGYSLDALIARRGGDARSESRPLGIQQAA